MEADPTSHFFHEVQRWVTTPAVHKMDAPALASAMRDHKPTIERDGVRILGGSEAKTKFKLEVAGASKSAIAAIEKAGGSITVQAAAEAEKADA